MKLEHAYSLDLKEKVTAAEADITEGIQFKHRFSCSDKENCDALVICANLERPKHLRKRAPYYKVVGEHSDTCSIAKDIENRQRKQRKTANDLYSGNDIYMDKVFRINLQPPSTKRDVTTLDSELDGDDGCGTRRKSGTEGTPTKNQATKTLSECINSYFANESMHLQLPDIGKMHINDLFIEIDGQNISDFPDEWRIYYGKAWFNKKENGYQVKFANQLTVEGITAQPTFFISTKALNNSGFAKYNHKTMEKIADTYPKRVCLLSETGPYLNKSQYINFGRKAPHHMVYEL